MIGNRNSERVDERGTARDEERRDEVLLALSKPIRRRALRRLDDSPSEVPLADLAAALADDPANRQRVATGLHHAHLPKLADCGLVDYDPERRRAAATVPPEVEPYLDRPD